MRLGFQAPVCRSTALPSDKGPSMLTNPLSFGDRLVSITDNPKEDIVKLVKEAELYDDSKSIALRFNFWISQMESIHFNALALNNVSLVMIILSLMISND